MTRSRVSRTLAMLACLAPGMSACRGDGPTATEDPANLKFASVTAGVRHTCALTTSGVAYCWGSNDHGELGNPKAPGGSTLVRVAGNLKFASLSAGGGYTCGITTASAAYCWGADEEGQLGDGTRRASRSTPVRASSLSFRSISAGAYHTCGMTTDGQGVCWGDNEFGMLGDGTTTDRLTPTVIAGGLAWKAIEVSHFHTCGLTTAGAAYCWGGDDGRLGIGRIDYIVRPEPVPVAGDRVLASLGTTHGAHLCGVAADGAASCWGFNRNGQLGDGTQADRLAPVTVVGGVRFTSVDGGGEVYSCGLSTAGAAYCWGWNHLGQLGTGDHNAHFSPNPAAAGFTFTQLALGAGQTCGVTTTEEIWCWGENDYGKLGNSATTAEESLVPVRVGK